MLGRNQFHLAAAQDTLCMYVSLNKPHYLPGCSGQPLSSVFQFGVCSLGLLAQTRAPGCLVDGRLWVYQELEQHACISGNLGLVICSRDNFPHKVGREGVEEQG